MATATYLKDGTGPLTVEYLTTAAVTIDEILTVGTTGAVSVGVARQVATASGETITVDIGGCYMFPKVSAAVIKAGESVDWDSSAGEVDDNAATSATGDVADFAIALADAGNGDTTVKVQLVPGHAAT